MKIGLLCEGGIDYAIIPSLVEQIARTQAGIRWPVRPDDVVERVGGIRRGGFGQVQKAVQKLCLLIDQPPFSEYAFFLIVLDRDTRQTQSAIKKYIKGHGKKFVIGIAIQKVEAWWLADRRNTLEWLALPNLSDPSCRYCAAGYAPEKDPTPKKTLDELTKLSPLLSSTYGDGNSQLAAEFASLWNTRAEIDQIKAACPKGFAPFCKKTAAALRLHAPRRK